MNVYFKKRIIFILAFYNAPRKSPRFINPNAKSLNNLTNIPKYPLLRPRINWTRNDFRFCTQPKIAATYNPILNLKDEIQR